MRDRELFLAALDIEDAAARRAYLQAECDGDAPLLARAEALLASHAGQSQFLQTPVVEQIVAPPFAELAATVCDRDGSVTSDEPATTALLPHGLAAMTEYPQSGDEEIPLGYLEPSAKAGALGRLAHYEVLEVVGRGAFGTVLRAFDEKLQRVVAIKVMAPILASTSPARKRFLREAQASAAIRHEHVVSIHAVEEKPIPYLVMEYIPGQTLQQRLDEQGPLDLPTVLRLGREIAEGLAAAHAQQLIHRDVKPGNILLETGVQERVKITDFGLARAADDASLTQSGTIAGTPMYMAPEQALGRPLDQRADLFSFGSVLYQMVSGRPPFRAPTALAVLKRVSEETPRPIAEIIPETPQWLCTIISKLHAKDPDDRYQTAREVAEVLADCESQLKSTAGVQDFSRLPRGGSAGSNRWRRVAAVGVLGVLVLLGAYKFGLRGREDTARVFEPWAGHRAAINAAADGRVELTAVTAQSPSQSDSPSVAVTAAREWVSLFNGQDLTGWKTTAELPGQWAVKDGVLTGSTQQSFLFSERADFANFHLRVEAKVNGLGNSELFVRAPFRLRHGPRAGWTQPASGYALELFNRTNPVGTITEIVKGAAPRILCRAVDNPAYRSGEWFTLELIAHENQLITMVNGAETVNCRDAARRYAAGHLVLSVGDPLTVVEFRKIEIQELPATAVVPSLPADQRLREYASDEWIDVIPLIDPRLDKWDMRLTGKNDWRIEQGELVVGRGDDKPHKLLFPLDADFFPSFECELEVTRRAGDDGFGLNFPTANGDSPIHFDAAIQRGVFVRKARTGIASISAVHQLETGTRTTLRVEVRRQAVGDRITVWNNGEVVGTWTGDRNELVGINNEGYEHRRRLSLWLSGGWHEFVFHRIRVRMLDGGTAESLRPVAGAEPAPGQVGPG